MSNIGKMLFLIRIYLPKSLWMARNNDWSSYMDVLNAIRYCFSDDKEIWDITTHLLELSNNIISIEGDCG